MSLDPRYTVLEISGDKVYIEWAKQIVINLSEVYGHGNEIDGSQIFKFTQDIGTTQHYISGKEVGKESSLVNLLCEDGTFETHTGKDADIRKVCEGREWLHEKYGIRRHDPRRAGNSMRKMFDKLASEDTSREHMLDAMVRLQKEWGNIGNKGNK